MKIFFQTAAAISGLLVLLLTVISCGNSTSESGNAVTATTSVKMVADNTLSPTMGLYKTALFKQLTKQSACTTAAMDGPESVAGLDCDGDGGAVQYTTPESFKIAFKRLTFITGTNSKVDIIPDRGTLANSQVFNITSLATIAQQPLAAGTYASFQAEIYYYEIKMKINSSPEITQSLRVYLSDDDFPSEGDLGHHQGDITFIDASGAETGWVGVGTKWTAADLQTNKASVLRPGSTDSETGHQRGLFGDSTLWNQSAFNQGSGKDIFLLEKPLGLVISGTTGKTVTFSFSIKDSWFYEDFDGNQKFNPCESAAAKDACVQNAEWAAIFNPPAISIQ
jgi:hypothetical protein